MRDVVIGYCFTFFALFVFLAALFWRLHNMRRREQQLSDELHARGKVGSETSPSPADIGLRAGKSKRIGGEA